MNLRFRIYSNDKDSEKKKAFTAAGCGAIIRSDGGVGREAPRSGFSVWVSAVVLLKMKVWITAESIKDYLFWLLKPKYGNMETQRLDILTLQECNCGGEAPGSPSADRCDLLL